jgi:hypothetical protein
METPCGNCFDPTRATFDEAGIVIPATAPINARIRIMRSTAGWGVVVVIKIKYDGVEYESGYGRGIASGFGWREVAVEL